MTSDNSEQDGRPAAGRGRSARVAGLALLFLVAGGVAAYGDWIWWEPSRGLTITLFAGAVLVAAGLLATIPRARRLALIAGVVGVGVLAGQNLGPSRPALRHGEGVLTATLSTPRVTTGTIVATCAMDDGTTELQVASEPNLRLDILADDPSAPPDVDQREFVQVSITVGDRWQPGPGQRSDGTVLQILVGRVEADAPESRMRSDSSSSLDIDWTGDGGTLQFSGLIPDTGYAEATGEFIDLAGTIEWTCHSVDAYDATRRSPPSRWTLADGRGRAASVRAPALSAARGARRGGQA